MNADEQLLDAFADEPERYEWYAARASEQRWTVRHLRAQIDLRLHERTGAAVANFPAVLEPADAQRALDATKDPYVFDFLDLSESGLERELKQALIDGIQRFLLELGAGFAFPAGTASASSCLADKPVQLSPEAAADPPTGIAHQILDDRGWAHIRDGDGNHYAWDAPNGERFWHTDDAVRCALIAECLDSRMGASARLA